MNARFTRERAVRSGCLLRRILFLAICVTIPEAAWGQQVTAAITGKITDPSDAAIAGARAEAKDIAQPVKEIEIATRRFWAGVLLLALCYPAS
jgi:hypothetical protein